MLEAHATENFHFYQRDRIWQNFATFGQLSWKAYLEIDSLLAKIGTFLLLRLNLHCIKS